MEKKVKTLAAKILDTNTDTLGLGDLGLESLLAPQVGISEIMLELIEEDPEQPRTHFDPEELESLTESIRQRGVKTPISLRPHPDKEGFYMINHGARRYRAAIMAGLNTIPAHIDTEHNQYDQFMENRQRDDFTPIEIALFLQKELETTGIKKQELAEKIVMNPASVTQYLNLLELPPVIDEVFKAGRTKDVTVLYDLTTLYKKEPAMVENWINTPYQEINRSSLKVFKDAIKGIKGIKGMQGAKEEKKTLAAKPDEPEIDNEDEAKKPQAKKTKNDIGAPQKLPEAASVSSVYEKNDAIYCKTMDRSGVELDIKLVTFNVAAPELIEAVQKVVVRILEAEGK